MICFTTKRTFYWSALVLLTVCVCGCGGKKKPDGFPKLYPCQITVKQEGVPLSKAMVVLFPEEDSNPWSVGGGTNDNGVAEIYTHGDFAGAPVGNYKVTITKNVIEGAPSQTDLENPNFAGPMGTAYDYVDLQYKSRRTTPLRIEITAGKNAQEFDVGPAIRETVKIER